MEGRHVYGLDIETDTTYGVDPAIGPIRCVVLSTAQGELVFGGDEAELIDDLDDALAELEPGLLATWGGGALDLPYLADRAALHGVALGLSLAADPRLRVPGRPLPGHRGAYRAAWYAHRHVDASLLYRSGRGPLVEAGARLAQLTRRRSARRASGFVEHDQVVHEGVHAFATNDARLARVLVERRRASALRHVDRIVRPADRVSAAASGRVDERWSTPGPSRWSPAHPAVRALVAAQR